MVAQKRVPKANYVHEEKKMSVEPVDTAPEPRTKRCSPRFRPGDRFGGQGSDTCCQAVDHLICDRSLSPTPAVHCVINRVI